MRKIIWSAGLQACENRVAFDFRVGRESYHQYSFVRQAQNFFAGKWLWNEKLLLTLWRSRLKLRTEVPSPRTLFYRCVTNRFGFDGIRTSQTLSSSQKHRNEKRFIVALYAYGCFTCSFGESVVAMGIIYASTWSLLRCPSWLDEHAKAFILWTGN